MCYWIVHKFVLWKYSLVAALHMLILLSETLVTKCFLINVFQLTCDDIYSLVVVFVNG
jgi:hypothetical protein